MFETENFRVQLENAVAQEAARNGITQYDGQIVKYLQDRATENEADLMAIEIRKAVTERRGVPDALKSARELIRVASVLVLGEDRKTLTQADVELAYRVKFCEVWPFCK